MDAIADALSDFVEINPGLNAEGLLTEVEDWPNDKVRELSEVIWNTPFPVRNNQALLNKCVLQFGMNNKSDLSPVYDVINDLGQIDSIRVRASNWADEYIAWMNYYDVLPKSKQFVDWKYKTSHKIELPKRREPKKNSVITYRR